MGISLITIKFLVTFFVNEETFGAGSLPATEHMYKQNTRTHTKETNSDTAFGCFQSHGAFLVSALLMVWLAEDYTSVLLILWHTHKRQAIPFEHEIDIAFCSQLQMGAT